MTRRRHLETDRTGYAKALEQYEARRQWLTRELLSEAPDKARIEAVTDEVLREERKLVNAERWREGRR